MSRMPARRSWFAVAAVAIVLLSLVPPAETYARRYVFAESLQFLVFATVVPALLVLGAPWRALGVRARDGRGLPGSPGFVRGGAILLVFVGTVIGWRLPASVDALATWPGFAVLEMVTLVAAGSALWLQLVESPPFLPRMPRPARAFCAAVPMWTIWIIGYILGFSQVAWFSAYARRTGLGPVADQEITAGLMLAIPALCLVPVVYVNLMIWLKDTEDPEEELRAIVRSQNPHQPGRWPRPPRGWDTHSA